MTISTHLHNLGFDVDSGAQLGALCAGACEASATQR